METIKKFDRLSPMKQDNKQATYTRLLRKDDRIINWNSPAEQVYRQFKALTPFPGVVTQFRHKRLLIKSMEPVEKTVSPGRYKSGTIISIDDGKLRVSCASGEIYIISCQPESRKPLAVGDFINGYQVKTGEILGTGV